MIEKKKCKYCDKEYYGTAKAVFCSAKCRVYFWREQNIKKPRGKRIEQKEDSQSN